MVSLSILTACLPAKDDYIHLTAESVEACQEPAAAAGVELEWVLCYDGEGPKNPIPTNADKVINLAHHSGVAVARNVALAHAAGDLFMPLDADDLICHEGILGGVEELLRSSSLTWVAGNRLSLEGDRTRHWTGRNSWAARYLAWDWTSPFPFHPSTFIMRRREALELGGWPALPACEDVGFILEASERYSGMALEDVFILDRKWEKQTGSTEGYMREKKLAYQCIEALINSNREKRRDPLIVNPLSD